MDGDIVWLAECLPSTELTEHSAAHLQSQHSRDTNRKSGVQGHLQMHCELEAS